MSNLESTGGELYLGSVDINASAMTGAIYQIVGIDVDATPASNAKLTGADISLNNIFYFKSDSLDVGDSDVAAGTDIRVFCNIKTLGDRIEAAINSIGAQVSNNTVLAADASTTSTDGLITSGTNGQYEGPMPHGSGTATFGKDIVRYMAWQLTNGYGYTDVFSNEDALLTSISNILNDGTDGVVEKLKLLVSTGTGLGAVDGSGCEADGSLPDAGPGVGSTLEDSDIVGPVIKYFDTSDDWVQFLVDLSNNDTDAETGWTPIPVTRTIKLNLRVVITDIAGNHHDGTTNRGGAGGAGDGTSTANTGGGTNTIGDRSYTLQLTHTVA